jgi:predicted RNA-binding Zn ribbon-like protein
MAQHQFNLVAAHPSLELLNTISDWTAAEPRDYLPELAEAFRLGTILGLLTPAEARRLSMLPPGTELRRLKELRSRLQRIVRSLIDGKAPAREDLDALARDTADAARDVELRMSGDRLERVIPVDKAGVATLRWRLVETAITLLASDELARVGACPTCGWFFLDTTKNRSRRWCSMAMCGSVSKARRYYWRTRRPAAS